ncbi:hypothetical protein [Streptomyces sp. NPDC058579]|uniref:hypothetical protein n=1 Tax=Streptomyces sp. NPDC058579 TaxID=3346548 RepID=UPI0036552EE1
MSYRTNLRSLVIGACTAALLAGSGLITLPAQAQEAQSISAARSTRAELQVADFWGQYVDATNAVHSEGKDALTIRKEFLTPELDEALTEWGSANQKDPVFRSQEIPKSADWATAGESNGHEKVVLTQTFEDGTTNVTWYQVHLTTFLIDGLQDATA